MKRRVAQDQITLVTATLVKRKNISEIQTLRHYNLRVRVMIIAVKMFYDFKSFNIIQNNVYVMINNI